MITPLTCSEEFSHTQEAINGSLDDISESVKSRSLQKVCRYLHSVGHAPNIVCDGQHITLLLRLTVPLILKRRERE